jgi:type VI secretion system Hcp family effector
MKRTLTIIATLGLAALANAQPAQSTITIDVPDLNCSTPANSRGFSVQGWSFGATNPPATPGGTPVSGRVQISAITIAKTFDECSTALFGAVTTGKHIPTLTLTQSDATGHIKEMTVKLTDVLVSNYQLGGAPTAAEPIESINFSFGQISITNNKNNTQASWDTRTGKP